MCQEEYHHISEPNKRETNSTNHKIKAYFAEMAKPTDIPYSEYLHIAHDLSGLNKFEDRTKDHRINLADFLPRAKIIVSSLTAAYTY